MAAAIMLPCIVFLLTGAGQLLLVMTVGSWITQGQSPQNACWQPCTLSALLPSLGRAAAADAKPAQHLSDTFRSLAMLCGKHVSWNFLIDSF